MSEPKEEITIDEAEKRLALLLKEEFSYHTIYYHDALKLGIEALKRCKERSDRFANLPHLRLPGETKD